MNCVINYYVQLERLKNENESETLLVRIEI